MKRCPAVRERYIYKFSKKNRWYKYEEAKKHLNPQQWEVEVRATTKHLKV